MEEFKNILNLFGQDYAWVIQVFLVVLVAMVINFFQKRALHRLHLKFKTTRNLWDDVLIEAAKGPLTMLVWLLGLTFAAEIVQSESKAVIFEAIGPIRNVGVILILAMFIIRLIKGAESNLVERETETGEKDFDPHTVEAIAKLLRVSVMITSGLVMLQTLGYSISGVLAFGGIGGIAVGFAAKDMLANFFGGLIIYLDRPFLVGDWIRSNDRDIEGTVEHIGWRLTRIRTFDKRPLYVPNSVFSSIAVENPSRMTNRRIYETLGIRYQDADKMSVIVQDVKTMLQNHPAIDTSQTMIVNFNSFAASSIDFFVYTFTRTTAWIEFHEIKQDVLLKIMDIISAHGAEIAFPTSTLHVDSLPNMVEPER
ncbi:MAG: mechanosensitive ion channel family protein [Gammaproteobacteria bacterium]|nr:mechanosensitive ion channel family protein [Gammaproteobacteria bacterium]